MSESGQGVEGDSGVRENYTRVMPWKCYSVNNTLVGVSGPWIRQLRELSSSLSHDSPSIVRCSIVRKRGREKNVGFANITRPPGCAPWIICRQTLARATVHKHCVASQRVSKQGCLPRNTDIMERPKRQGHGPSGSGF